MTFRLFPLRVLALMAFALLAVQRVSAEPVQWSYQGQIVTTGPSQGFNGEPLGPHVLISEGVFPLGVTYDPGNQVQFADVKGSGSGATLVTAFQMRASTYFDAYPFTKNLHTFNLGFGILDKASGASGKVTFQGWLDGRMSSGLSSAFVDLQVGFTGALQKSLVLGNHLYKVSIDPFGFGWAQDLSSIKTLPVVTPYQNVPIHVQVSDVPEPSTLALTALGLSGLGLRAWRRRCARRSPR
jgi:hypothetical protein